MPIRLTKEPRPPIPDDGSYVAKFVDATEQKTKYGNSIRFWFEITKGRFKGSRVSRLCDAKWQAGNSLDATLIALGVDKSTEDGEDIALDDLIGTKVRVLVEVRETSRGNPIANARRVSSFGDEEDDDEERPRRMKNKKKKKVKKHKHREDEEEEDEDEEEEDEEDDDEDED